MIEAAKREEGPLQYERLVNEVRREAGLELGEQAARCTEAFLETLGELLSKTERDHLAAELPGGLKEAVRRRPGLQVFNLEEFYERVRARADVGYPEAVKQARAVAAVLRRQVSAGELEDVLRELPAGYAELLGEAPPGPLSPSRVD